MDQNLFKIIDSTIRNKHLYRQVSLMREDICDRFHIGRHHLNDLLNTYAGGMTFPQYINAIRLQEALRLLRDEPAKTVAAIATEIGLSSANLREQFKRKYGITPVEYRRNMNN